MQKKTKISNPSLLQHKLLKHHLCFNRTLQHEKKNSPTFELQVSTL